MKIYRNDDGTFFRIDKKGYPEPVSRETAWALITEEGYELENTHFSNNEESVEIDINKLQEEIEELQKIKLDEELETTKDWFFYGIDRVKNEFDTYYRWARETKYSIPEAEVSDEPNLFVKGSRISQKVKDGTAFKISDNLYIFRYDTFYLYGHLVSNADFWRFIGIKVKKEYEKELLEVARVDFSIINGIF